jgi:hypothetical protein
VLDSAGPRSGDSLGPVPIPTPPTIAAFPLLADFGSGIDYNPPMAVHIFDQPGLKTEQRFLLAPSTVRRYKFSRDHLSCTEYDRLKAHWEQAQGSYAQFPYTAYLPTGQITATVRYENPAIQFQHMIALIVGGPGLTFLEVPTATPAFTSGARLNRFPDATLATALTAQMQEIIPLIKIVPRNSAPANTLYLSNQRFTLDGQLYLPRLLDWSGIVQSAGESSDACSMNFGNADGVWIDFVNQIPLYAAQLQVSLYHVQSQYILDLWSGYVTDWGFDTDGKFQLNVSDGVFWLTLPYPTRKLLRTCWKVYKGRYCPSTSSYPDCPKDWDSCVARGVSHSFGGMVIPPQSVRIKDNSTGVFGFGRSAFTSVTVVDDTVYQRPLQEVYTDEPMSISTDVAAGRDEGDYYAALGIVGEGPISSFNGDLVKQLLDGQPPHDPLNAGGFRGVIGTDPASNADFIGITQAPWRNSDGSIFIPSGSTYSGGLAMVEIRRTDPKGLQLSAVSDHAITANVIGGIGGWVWTAPGARTWLPALHNTVWVAINVYLRGIGLRCDQTNESAIPPAVMEQYFDVSQAMAMASICDTVVPKLIPNDGTTELQFPFRGVLKEQKPLKQWLQEILSCCLGGFTFVNGKLWIYLRYNSSVLAGNAYTRAHMLWKTFQATPFQPQFNWLTGNFGDEEFGFQLNNVTLYDIDHASFLGTPDSPQYLMSTLNFVGVSNKSQCARLVTTRLREEVGGIVQSGGTNEQPLARNFSFKTTIMALGTMVGDIVSVTDPRMPGGYAEGRVSRWSLNPDWSIDIAATGTFDDMYDLVAGPKPVDVSAPPVPQETVQSAAGVAWVPNELAPQAGDPVYPSWERTFDLWQEYDIATDGTWIPVIGVQGEMNINQYVSLERSRIADITYGPGGSLDGPLVVYVAITERDATGAVTTPSNLSAIFIPATETGQKLTLDTIAPPSAWTGWDLWAGNDRRRMVLQFSGTGALPASIDIPGPLHDWTMGMPNNAAYGIRIAAKKVWHGAVAGLAVTDVPSASEITCHDFVGSTDPWVGRIAFVISNKDGNVPVWNFTITAFDGATGTITVTPSCTGIEVGDVLGVYSIAVSADATSVTDPMWDNSVNRAQFNSPGFPLPNPGTGETGEVGRVVRVFQGTGAGQARLITDNDATTLHINKPWDVIPDQTSLIIVEAPDWPYYTETSSQLIAPTGGDRVALRVEVPNLADQVVLVGGFLVDRDDNATDEQFACFRMIYIFGQPPMVREVGPEANDPATGTPWLADVTDQSIRADTSANDVNVQLLPIAQYDGRTMLICADGANNVIVTCDGSELLFDGSSSVTLPGYQTLRVTAG